MKIDVKEINLLNLGLGSENVIILPYNYESDKDYEYSSTALSFYKYAKEKLDIGFFTEPELLVEQRSGDWFGPTLLISTAAILQNPELISILCGVVANYITDFFKNTKKPEIELKIVCEETKLLRRTEITYKGNVKGLDMLESSIKKVVNREP